MIEIKPEMIPDSSKILLVAREDNSLMGKITLDTFEHYLRIFKIVIPAPDPDNLILDMLIRASASYALNRQIFAIQCLDERFFEKLKQLNFYDLDNSLFIEIHRLPKSCNK